MPLLVFSSQKLERLADKFALDRAARPIPPLSPDPVVVQSPGMRRYLTMRVADRVGVAANLRFLSPNDFLDDLFDRALGPRDGGDPFAPADLAWRILRRLGDLPKGEPFAGVSAYVEDGDARKLLRFCRTLADLYERYAIHRPDRVLAWQRGDDGETRDERWQAALWRLLLEELPANLRGLHRAARHAAFRERAGEGRAAGRLPHRATVFGVSTLPPMHLDALVRLGALRPVGLYLLNPCADYWGSIRSARENLNRGMREGMAADELFLEEGHPLLASLGRLGREFFDLRVESGLAENPEDEPWPDGEEPFAPTGGGTLLERLQDSLLTLAEPGGPRMPPIAPPDPDDRSIQIHACHGPRREVETLHERLLDLFARDADLAPHDVVVTAPDIEPYVPFIEAVFGMPECPSRRIPHTIADRRIDAASAYARAFLALLSALDGRADAPALLSLLDPPPARRRFGLTEEDLARFRLLAGEARIRTGRDVDDGDDVFSPPAPANTWHAGFERLLLGFSLDPSAGPLFRGAAPHDDVDPSDAGMLGGVGAFLEFYFRARARAAERLPPAAWRDELAGWLDGALLPDAGEEGDREAILAALGEFAASAARGGFDGALPFPAVRDRIVAALEAAERGRGFLAGGVTFCSMLPMRSVPAKVVALLGLNDGDFPRSADPPGFDWSAAKRRPGDRSRRDDDRFLFLETILSARRALYLSYAGRDPRDNRALPPSVALAELLDALEAALPPGPAATLRERLTLRHPLQPFSPSLFEGREDLFSHSGTMRETAEALRRSRAAPRSPRPFFEGPLPQPAEDEPATLEGLRDFLRNPARFLIRKRLSLALPGDLPEPEEREPFALGGLERFLLRDALLALPDGADPEVAYETERARGTLPHGQTGRLVFAAERSLAAAFLDACHGAGDAGAPPAPVPVRIRLPAGTLEGSLDRVRAGRRVVRRPGTLKGRSLLDAWVGHLALVLTAGEGAETLIVALEKRKPEGKGAARPEDGEDVGERHPVLKRFAPVAAETARGHLSAYLDALRDGSREPVPAFAGALVAFARAESRGKDEETAFERAREELEGGGFPGAPRGEGDDPYVRLAFSGREILDARFAALARALARPAIEALHG